MNEIILAAWGLLAFVVLRALRTHKETKHLKHLNKETK
jgi:hypothetical protein